MNAYIGNNEIVKAIRRTNEAFSRIHSDFDFDGKVVQGYHIKHNDGGEEWIDKQSFDENYRPLSEQETDFATDEGLIFRKKGCCLGAR